MRFAALLGAAVLCLSVPAFGQITDPVGFCPPPVTAAACTTPTGSSKETISVGTTTFGMFASGNAGATSTTTWELFVAVPNDVGGAPTITPNTSFMQMG